MAQVNITVRESGVRKSVSERIKRVIVHIQVVTAELLEPFALSQRASGILVRIVKRYLTDVLRESHGQLAAWVDVAEEGIADSISSFATTEPYIQDGRYVLLFPVQRERPAGE